MVTLLAACALLVILIGRETLVRESRPEAPSTSSATSTSAVTTTVPSTPLCRALQYAQLVSLSRGGGEPSEVAAGLVTVMPEYIDAMRDVLREAEAGGVPQTEIVFLSEAIAESSALVSELMKADQQQVMALIAASAFSEQRQVAGAPTLYAIASGACRAGLGVRVQ